MLNETPLPTIAAGSPQIIYKTVREHLKIMIKSIFAILLMSVIGCTSIEDPSITNEVAKMVTEIDNFIDNGEYTSTLGCGFLSSSMDFFNESTELIKTDYLVFVDDGFLETSIYYSNGERIFCVLKFSTKEEVIFKKYIYSLDGKKYSEPILGRMIDLSETVQNELKNVL
jgi:hypothetical protein